MSKDLSELARKLEQSKSRELEQVKQIESEKLHELSQSLRESLEKELTTLEGDMIERHTNLAKRLSQIRVKTYKAEEEGLKQIEDEAISLLQAVNRVKVRYWIVPLIVAASLIIGLVAGMWGLGVAISGRTQTLTQLNEQIAEAKKQREAVGQYDQIVETYRDAIEIKKKPNVWQTDKGTWAVQFKE